MIVGVGIDVADAFEISPIVARKGVKDIQERLFAFVVDGNIYERMLAEKGFRLIGNMRSAKDDEHLRIDLLQSPCSFQRYLRIPDIGAESDDIGPDQAIDNLADRHPLVDHGKKIELLRLRQMLTGIGLQASDRVGQIVLPRKAVIDLNEANLYHAR